MVGPGVRAHQLTVDIAADPSQISEQVRAEVGWEEWLAVLGGKDDRGGAGWQRCEPSSVAPPGLAPS